jgi:hypothetical protein
MAALQGRAGGTPSIFTSPGTASCIWFFEFLLAWMSNSIVCETTFLRWRSTLR